MGKLRTYSDQQFIEAVRQSPSIRQTLKLLHLKEAGGNYRSCKDKIKSMNIDTSHFEGGRAWSKGRKFAPKRKLEVYLNNEVFINSSMLRLRLIKEGYFKPECSMCNLSTWLDRPISLELDHINGDYKNNKLENLRILCPNCHATTSTYRGKNIKHIAAPDNSCIDCQTNISSVSKRCKSCTAKRQPTKIVWPSTEELKRRLQTISYLALARELGVSDNSICKRIGRGSRNRTDTLFKA